MANAPDAAVGRFVSALSVLLTRIQVDDGQRDASNPFVWLWHKLQAAALSSVARQSSLYFARLDPTFHIRLRSILEQQLELEEARGVSLPDFVTPTANAYRYVFGLLGKVVPQGSKTDFVANVGTRIGAATVIADCVSDWKEDLAAGRANPATDDASARRAISFVRCELEAASQLMMRELGPDSRGVAIINRVLETVGDEITCMRCAAQPLLGVQASPFN